MIHGSSSTFQLLNRLPCAVIASSISGETDQTSGGSEIGVFQVNQCFQKNSTNKIRVFPKKFLGNLFDMNYPTYQGVPNEVFYPSETENSAIRGLSGHPQTEETVYESWTPGGGYRHERAIRKVHKQMRHNQERVDRGELRPEDVRDIRLNVRYLQDTPQNRESSKKFYEQHQILKDLKHTRKAQRAVFFQQLMDKGKGFLIQGMTKEQKDKYYQDFLDSIKSPRTFNRFSPY